MASVTGLVRRKVNKGCRMLCLLLCIMCLTACGKPGDVMKAFSKDELFRIDSVACTQGEYQVYLSTIQSRYEDVYGVEVWQIARGNVTLEDNVKDTVLARLAQVKTMYLLAESKEIKLEEAEEEAAKKAGEEYCAGLSQETMANLSLNQETVVEMFREYALAEKVYRTILESINPEISDDEARSVTVERILFQTYTTDGTGSRVEYSDTMKNDVFDRAAEVLQQALEGADFAELAEKYSDTPEVKLSFAKQEQDPALERTAFNLETDEISAVIETQDGYQILKCISTFDREQTEKNKKVLLERRREEAFVKELEAFTEGLSKKLNESKLQEISPDHTGRIDVPDFFEIYSKYF
ncbi:MAG: peptidylprolyl isomerase [Acetatifactor sp.]|nr:peptidylprolyl isomerase [Acetatifactor sp.]